MAKKQTIQDYVIGLEDNAFSSLEHGVEHYLAGDDADLKFTVLHISHAVELLLKARLAKAHPLLLLQKPEDDPGRGYTADYTVVVKRLRNLGVQLTTEDAKSLEFLRLTRNKIEHYEMQGNRLEIEEYVARAIKLLNDFVEKELDIRLEERIKPGIYREMELVLYSYEERLDRVWQRMDQALPTRPEERGEYQKGLCDECAEEAVWVPDPQSDDRTVKCYNCDTKFSYWTCDSCGGATLSSPSDPPRETDFCEMCWDNLLTKD